MLGLGYQELLIIGVLGLLLYGSRLPEVARGLGKGLTEFKKGMRGIEDEVRNATNDRYEPPTTPPPPRSTPDPVASVPSAPKFEPPTLPPS